jgi:hypothetical protein
MPRKWNLRIEDMLDAKGEGLIPQIKVLHLATHSKFNFTDYLQSAILFHDEQLTLARLISDQKLDFQGLRREEPQNLYYPFVFFGNGWQLYNEMESR